MKDLFVSLEETFSPFEELIFAHSFAPYVDWVNDSNKKDPGQYQSFDFIGESF
jgi:hypothetical protein